MYFGWGRDSIGNPPGVGWDCTGASPPRVTFCCSIASDELLYESKERPDGRYFGELPRLACPLGLSSGRAMDRAPAEGRVFACSGPKTHVNLCLATDPEAEAAAFYGVYVMGNRVCGVNSDRCEALERLRCLRRGLAFLQNCNKLQHVKFIEEWRLSRSCHEIPPTAAASATRVRARFHHPMAGGLPSLQKTFSDISACS